MVNLNSKFSLLLILSFSVLLFGCITAPQSQDVQSVNQTSEINNSEKLVENQETKQVQNAVNSNEKRGAIGDETWRGEVLITESVFVPSGKTLKIEPGAIVKFKECRDYKGTCNRLSLEVEGQLLAQGTQEQPIFFTSAAQDARNGDWSMIRLFGNTNSEIDFAVIEFGQQGVNMWKSNGKITNSVIRWNNWEGLYAESYSTPLIAFNHIYENGYNGMALEQFNDANISYNVFEKSGTNGLHVDASKIYGEGNVIRNNNAHGLSLDDHAEVKMSNSNFTRNQIFQVVCGEGKNIATLNNVVIIGESENNCEDAQVTRGTGVKSLNLFNPKTSYNLGYTPGDRQKDKYEYVYPEVDETRKVVNKLGQGKGLAWSVALEEDDIWTVVVNGDAFKYGYDSKVLREFKVSSSQPWGATFLGGKLWVTDFAEKRTYAVDPNTGLEVFSFNNPDQERGAKGLANDGENLLLMGWTTGVIYKLTQKGELLEEIQMSQPLGGGGIAFDGASFWIPCDGQICKYDKKGNYLGRIYSASEGTWDLEWDFTRKLLWATQRTNENWHDDSKVFALEILKTV